VERGTTPSIGISSNRNFDLFLWVTTVTDHDSASKVVWIDGMPTVSISGNNTIPPDDFGRYDAVVAGGDPPYSYHWILTHSLGPLEDYGTAS
jgi:hypothetical protein